MKRFQPVLTSLESRDLKSTILPGGGLDPAETTTVTYPTVTVAEYRPATSPTVFYD